MVLTSWWRRGSDSGSDGTGTSGLPNGVELSLLPLKPGDHVWRTEAGGGTCHAIFVGQFILTSSEDGAVLSVSAPPPVVASAQTCVVPPISLQSPAASTITASIGHVVEPRTAHSEPAAVLASSDCKASASDAGDTTMAAEANGVDSVRTRDETVAVGVTIGDPTSCASTAAPKAISTGSSGHDGSGRVSTVCSTSVDACVWPHAVVAVRLPPPGAPGAGSISRIPLEEFVAGGDCRTRLYTRRPRGRRAAVLRALEVIGCPVDEQALAAFPQMLPWWAIFDDSPTLQPGLCPTRARAVRYRLTPRVDAPVQPAVMDAVLAGGAVVRRGRAVLRGVRLMKALRLTKAAAVGWANLGGMVGQAIAANVLDDGSTSTAVATAAGGWAGGLAGGGLGAAALSSMGVEAVASGLVLCSALSATGAVAGAGLAYATKKALDQPIGADRTAEFHDCPFHLIGAEDDFFNLFDATLEFPPEDATDGDELQRVAAVGWYAVRT
eukprot:TRINITY_DN68762_c0_g1_i1.p1 TRINITY_DN68762_c0_g1~~TRINITY_DN68762_c0_g1_i1.p1  ORF type:complete len:495 (-),score=90.20 TRINITY_DN68762_c0_g1_i1:52-1536(-)